MSFGACYYFRYMASLIRQPTSKYLDRRIPRRIWQTDTGARRAKPTRNALKSSRNNTSAWRKAKGKPQRVRKTLTEFIREHYGEELPFATVRDFARTSGSPPSVETSPATFARYEQVVGKFLTFLGEAANRALRKSARARSWLSATRRLPRSAVMTANTKLKIIKRIMRSARLEGYLLPIPPKG